MDTIDPSTPLKIRRAMFVYDATRSAAIAARAPIVPLEWLFREEEFKEQFIKVIERQCGAFRDQTPQQAHDSWWQAYRDMGWKYGDVYNKELKTHPDMIPFEELGQLERDKDSVYIAACDIARQWIY